MRSVTESAYAKVNLTLDVLGLRPDGYHEMDMVMQSVSLSDRVTMTLKDESGITLHTNRAYLPTDGRNLAVRAAQCGLERLGKPRLGLAIEIVKRIPVCAGTAGGSSDAAAVLRGLNRLLDAKLSKEDLMDLGAQIGSDVPYCVYGETARARGRGEIIAPVPALPPCYIILCKPHFSISTPELFRKIDGCRALHRPDTDRMLRALAHGELSEIAKALGNVFEDVLPSDQRKTVRAIRAVLAEEGALGSCMSGTGPTVFGIFEREAPARRAVARLKKQYKEVFFTKSV